MRRACAENRSRWLLNCLRMWWEWKDNHSTGEGEVFYIWRWRYPADHLAALVDWMSQAMAEPQHRDGLLTHRRATQSNLDQWREWSQDVDSKNLKEWVWRLSWSRSRFQLTASFATHLALGSKAKSDMHFTGTVRVFQTTFWRWWTLRLCLS